MGEICNHCCSKNIKKYPRKLKKDPTAYDNIIDALKRVGLYATDIQIEISARY
jgi:hypothetical protein